MNAPTSTVTAELVQPSPADALGRGAWDVGRVLANPPGSVRGALHGTRLVPTLEMRLATSYARGCVSRGEMMAIDGPPGAGKTLLLEVLAAASPVRTYQVSFPGTTRSKRMWQVIADAVVGAGADGTETRLMDEVVDVLAVEPSLLILDEAINLRVEHLLALRHLDSNRNRCGIVLAGSGLLNHADGNGALATRITRDIVLHDLGDEEVLDYVRQLHPIFSTAPADLIMEINDKKTRGNRRRWLHIVTALADMGATALTAKTAALAIGRVPAARTRQGRR